MPLPHIPAKTWIIVLMFFPGWLSAQIVNIESRRKLFETDTTTWFGAIDLGFNFTQNGNSVYTFMGNAHFERQHQHNLWMSLSNYRLININGESFVNSGFQHFRYNRQVTEAITGEVFGQIQYDERLRIRLRGLLGAGPRFRLLSFDQGIVCLGFSYMYQYEEIAKTNIIHRDHRLNSYLSVNYEFLPGFRLISTSYYQPLLTDLNVTRFSSQSTILLKISNHLSFRSAFNITFDSRLSEDAAGVPVTVYSLVNGLKWTF